MGERERGRERERETREITFYKQEDKISYRVNSCSPVVIIVTSLKVFLSSAYPRVKLVDSKMALELWLS